MTPNSRTCQRWVYDHGQVILETHALPADQLDVWVRCVAQLCGQPVDWHYQGERAVVRALGDLRKVHQALRTLLPVHDQLLGQVAPQAAGTVRVVRPDAAPHARVQADEFPLIDPEE